MKGLYSVVNFLFNKNTSNRARGIVGFVEIVLRTPPQKKRCKKWTKRMGGAFNDWKHGKCKAGSTSVCDCNVNGNQVCGNERIVDVNE